MAVPRDAQVISAKLRDVFYHRDDTDISRRVLERDVPTTTATDPVNIAGSPSASSPDTATSTAPTTECIAYLNESFGSVELKTEPDVYAARPFPDDPKPAVAAAQLQEADADESTGTTLGSTKSKAKEPSGRRRQAGSKIDVKLVATTGFAPRHAEGLRLRDKSVGAAAEAHTPEPSRSALRTIMELRSTRQINPFDQFLQFSGDGHGDRERLRLHVFTPFADTEDDRHDAIEVQILRQATVRDVIGLAMCKYAKIDRAPKLKLSMDAYELRMVEDDGEPDLDLPALDAREPIAKFSFHQYCLCQSPKFDTIASEDIQQAEVVDGVASAAFVRVFESGGGATILKREPGMTIADVVEQTLRKRALRSNMEYVLELNGQVRNELKPSVEVSTLDEDDDGTPLEFLLVHKHSKRRNLEGEEADDSWAVEKSLTKHHARTYLLSKQNKFSSTLLVEMFVDTEKIRFYPYGKSGLLSSVSVKKQRRTIQIDVDQLIGCEQIEGSEKIRFTHYDELMKLQLLEFTASSAMEAVEIVEKISSIVESQGLASSFNAGERRTSVTKIGLGERRTSKVFVVKP